MIDSGVATIIISSSTSAAGAPSQRPRHSSSTSVNLPSSVVSPTSIPRCLRTALVTALWSQTSGDGAADGDDVLATGRGVGAGAGLEPELLVEGSGVPGVGGTDAQEVCG